MQTPHVVAGVLMLLLLGSARPSFADDDLAASSGDPQQGPLEPTTQDDDPTDEFSAFPLTVRHDKHWVRAGLEVGAVVTIGFVDYLLNTGARGGLVRQGDPKWALRYDWPELRAKLVGDAYELDANQFGTNYAAHPLAGSAYFQVARSNHLAFGEALLFSILGSSVWEYFGEIRERVSVNDMLVTPLAGTAIGETAMQLSGFFDRGKSQASNHVLAFLFSPIKKLNDLADGVRPARSGRDDDLLGFSANPWHRIVVRSGAGVTFQDAGSRRGADARSYGDLRFGTTFELANLPGYRGAARHARLFDDGNLVRLRAEGAISAGNLVDMAVETAIVPLGYYYRRASIDARGRLFGATTTVGLRMAYEYALHDYDRDRTRGVDQLSIVSPLGIELRTILDRGNISVEGSIHVGGGIAGVTPYAFTDWQRLRPATGLPTVVRNQGYYHALAVGTAPRLELRWRDTVVLEGHARVDSLHAIEGLDEAPETVTPGIGINDQRVSGGASLSWTLTSWATPIRIAVGGDRSARLGQIGDVRARRSETAMFAEIGCLF